MVSGSSVSYTHLAEVDGNLCYGSEDDKGVGFHLLSQYAGGEVLVEDVYKRQEK